MSDKVDKKKKARDTLSSIFSYYKKNEETIENIPSSFISDSSRDIPIAVQIPSAEQTEELKKTLKELLGVKDVIDGLSARDKQLMTEAANASTIRRRGNKK
jgi:hypothetical protein